MPAIGGRRRPRLHAEDDYGVSCAVTEVPGRRGGGREAARLGFTGRRRSPDQRPQPPATAARTRSSAPGVCSFMTARKAEAEEAAVLSLDEPERRTSARSEHVAVHSFRYVWEELFVLTAGTQR